VVFALGGGSPVFRQAGVHRAFHPSESGLGGAAVESA
tara:strand:+ start:170 stop:280 length:111 start_codon:yes stop_codon:yes gene_type:complete